MYFIRLDLTIHTSPIKPKAEVQSSTTLRIMDRYQEKIRTAPRALLLHSMRELSYHGGSGGTVKCVYIFGVSSSFLRPPSVPPANKTTHHHQSSIINHYNRRVSQTAKALGTAALGTLKRNASFRGGDELEARFEASRAVSFGVKEAYMLPFFAAGRGFITHLFDSLPCQVRKGVFKRLILLVCVHAHMYISHVYIYNTQTPTIIYIDTGVLLRRCRALLRTPGGPRAGPGQRRPALPGTPFILVLILLYLCSCVCVCVCVHIQNPCVDPPIVSLSLH